jgi:hypothetical protein
MEESLQYVHFSVDCLWSGVKAKETKKCLYCDVDDDNLVEFCQL